MKKLSLLALAIAFASCSQKGNEIKVGDSVVATWGGSWYLAKTTAVKDGKYDVLYGDNTSGTVSAEEIKAIPADPELKAGDKVMGAWSGAKLYEGTVTEAKPEGYLVTWTDGSAPSLVAKGYLLKKW